MILNLVYDASVGSAPTGFTAVLDSAVDFLQSNFSDPVTVTIVVGYGEIAGQPMSFSALGQSLTYIDNFGYAQIRSALAADAKSADDASAVATLPASDPSNGGNYWISLAEAKAIGLLSGVDIDGYVGFSSLPGLFDYDNSDGVTTGQYDFFGVVAHEITEVMGRQLLVGQTIGGLANGYMPMDLFHYSGPGVRDFIGTQAGYFSIDAGVTNLDNFNTSPSGDFGDWASSAGNDAFLAFGKTGVVTAVTPADMTAMDAIGWDMNVAVEVLPDLSIIAIAATGANIAFTVNNAGPGAAGASVTGIYLSTDSTIASGDTLLGTGNTPGLAAGATDNEAVAAAFPVNLAPGTYYIGVIADDADEVTEVSETNNVSSARVILGNDSGNSLTGTSGADSMFGFGGGDTLTGGAGIDVMIGGAGDDLYVIDLATELVTENPGEGTDTVNSSVTYTLGANLENLVLTGSGKPNATGNQASNVITGNAGINVLAGLAGADTLDGGAGVDTATYTASPSGVDVSLATGQSAAGDAAGDLLLNIENLTGSAFADTLEGNGGDNVLAGGAGVDTLSYQHALSAVTVSLAITTAQNTGGAGTDSVSRFENLTGSAYADTLIGSTGNNVISGGGGNDSLNGANGRDTLDGGSGADTMAGGSSHSTYLVDDTGDVIIEGAAAGNDTVLAAAGSYTLPANVEYLTYTGVGNFTGAGNDLANTLTGAAGEDALDGGAGNDKILGGGGNDSLTGGDGNDSLTGGAGADTLTGALGADRFIFTNIADFAAGASYDTIADFTHSQTDRIDLSLIDAKTTVADNQAFTFIGASGFHNIAGELHYAVDGTGIAVSGDVNGDGVADFRFEIAGVASLVSGDFYL